MIAAYVRVNLKFYILHAHITAPARQGNAEQTARHITAPTNRTHLNCL